MSENYQEDNQNETFPAGDICGEEHTAVNETVEPAPAEQVPVENTQQTGSAPTEQTADVTEDQEPEKRIAELEAKVAELNDQYLRKAAEFENFRKRINREKQDAIEFANQSLLLDLVQTMDDFERAIKSAETSKDFTSLYEGITMIEKRLSSQLENKWGLKRFDSEGQVFDPNQHEAIMREESAEIQEPMVKEEFIKGYTLKDRVIRSAKVKVLMPEGG
jgi:molecular chaperone GrpE